MDIVINLSNVAVIAIALVIAIPITLGAEWLARREIRRNG